MNSPASLCSVPLRGRGGGNNIFAPQILSSNVRDWHPLPTLRTGGQASLPTLENPLSPQKTRSEHTKYAAHLPGYSQKPEGRSQVLYHLTHTLRYGVF